ncbi:FkbM family methyltransferase [bacterium]|nr:FkbM family methyltransferase [bacterium]
MDLQKFNSVKELPKGNILLYGSGGYGQFVLKQIQSAQSPISVIGFLDDNKTGEVEGIPIYSYGHKPHADYILLTSSYWREIIANQTEINNEDTIYVADFLSGESNQQEIVNRVQGHNIKFYTPNNYLLQVSQHFDKIEPCMIDWISSFQKSKVFYDIGASNGVYSVFAGVAAKSSVYCFEPDAQNFSILDRNHYLNAHQLNSFSCFNIGLGESAELMKLHCQEYLAGTHGKVFDMDNRESQIEMHHEFERNVIVDSLDSVINRYNLAAPNYLKIDVDGAEIYILKGASKTLSSPNLMELMIEIEDDKVQQIEALMLDHGFKLSNKFSINEIILTPISGIMNYLFVRK